MNTISILNSVPVTMNGEARGTSMQQHILFAVSYVAEVAILLLLPK